MATKAQKKKYNSTEVNEGKMKPTPVQGALPCFLGMMCTLISVQSHSSRGMSAGSTQRFGSAHRVLLLGNFRDSSGHDAQLLRALEEIAEAVVEQAMGMQVDETESDDILLQVYNFMPDLVILSATSLLRDPRLALPRRLARVAEVARTFGAITVCIDDTDTTATGMEGVHGGAFDHVIGGFDLDGERGSLTADVEQALGGWLGPLSRVSKRWGPLAGVGHEQLHQWLPKLRGHELSDLSRLILHQVPPPVHARGLSD